MKTSIEPYTRLFCLQGTRILSDISYYFKFMNTITYRVKPKFAGPISEVVSQEEGKGYESKVTLHGGKFSPEEIEQCLVDNPGLKVQIDIGQKVRLSGVFVDGSAPREIDHETFLSVNEGDIVDVFFDAEFAKRYSLEGPGFPVLVLNQKMDFELINQIVLGDGDCVLRKRYGSRFEVEKTKNGKIFSDHCIKEPARINNRRVIFTEKDLEILGIIKNHRDQVTDIVISFISNAGHVEQLHKTLEGIFGDKLPEVTYKIETLEAIGHLPYILKDSEDYGLKPRFVIGCGDLEAQVKEDLGFSYFGRPSEKEVREALEEKIESIVRFLSQRGIKELSIAWGLGEDDDTTYKLRKIIGLEISYGVKINYWVTKATIGKSKGAEVVGVLEGIMRQRKEVIKGLLTELTGNVAGSNI